MKNGTKAEQKILWLSFCAGACFSLFEFVMAVYSHSQSVLMDAAYDAAELVVIGLTLFLTPLFYRPVTEKHPFGYAQVESVFVIIKGFMLLSVTIGLSVNSIQLAFSGGNPVNATQISAFQLALGAISVVVLLLMRRLNRNISSPTVDAEIYGWKLDVYYSIGMAAAFFVSTFLKNTPLAPILPYFDQIVAVLVVLFMVPEFISMLSQAVKSVFLFAPEQETVDEIKEITHQILIDTPYQTEFFDITRTGRRLWVTVYFSTQEETISVQQLREATQKLNTALAAQYDDIAAELLAQVEN